MCKKREIACVCLVSLIALLAGASLAHAELLAHWTFDDSGDDSVVTDSGPNGYHGVLNGRTTAAASVPGKDGNAFDFVGTAGATASDAVNLDAHVASLTPSSFTLSQWVQFDGGAQWYNSWSDGVNVSTYFTEIHLDGPKLFNANAGGTNLHVQPGLDWDAGNAWHHVVYTVAPEGTVIYVDGAPAASNSDTVGPADMVNAPIHLRIGEFLHTTVVNPLGFDGRIDDTQLYDEALNGLDVEWLYQNPGSPIPEPGTLLLLACGALGLLAWRRWAA